MQQILFRNSQISIELYGLIWHLAIYCILFDLGKYLTATQPKTGG